MHWKYVRAAVDGGAWMVFGPVVARSWSCGQEKRGRGEKDRPKRGTGGGLGYRLGGVGVFFGG